MSDAESHAPHVAHTSEQKSSGRQFIAHCRAGRRRNQRFHGIARL
jgi:hypothetical protein